MTRSLQLLTVLLLAATASGQPTEPVAPPAPVDAPVPAKTVTVLADFAKNTLTVSGDWADLSADPKVLTADRQPLPKGVTAARTKTGLAVRGPTADVLGLLVPGTRSLVVAVVDGPALRADLPTPTVGTAERVKEEKETEGSVVIAVPVSGAMPGVSLRVAEWPSSETQPLPALVLTHGTTAPITLAEPTPVGDPPAFRVRIPAREENAGPLDLVFQAQNPDGSLSPTAEITLTGNTPVKAVRVVKDGRPAAVAEWGEAPACVLLTAEKAAAACKQAGLVPVFYDPASGRELSVEELTDEPVAAQGVEAGARVRKGSPLLLAFRPPPTIDLPAAFATAPGIEVDAPLGLVPVRRGGLLGLPAAERPARRLTQENDDEPNEDPRVQLAAAGVSIDPTRPVADDGFTAAVQQVIGGARTSTAENPLAAAVRAGSDGGEAGVRKALLEAKGVEALPADAVLDAVADKLGLKLSDKDRSAALEAWKADAGRMPVYALDANRDGRVADDIAVRLIQLLWQQGKYDPASHFQVVPAQGGSVAVLPPKPVDPNWKKTVPAIQIDSGTAKPVRIPKGPAAATGSSTPSAVRVPAVSSDEMVKDYIAKLRAVGLKFKKGQETVQAGDPVANVDPGQKKWVPVGSTVTVTVNRRTPSVVGMTFADAEKVLGKIDLRVKPSVARLTPAADDEIVEQQPRAEETSPANGVVYVRCKRKVPDVTGKPAADAVARLKDEWFDPEVIDRLALHDTITAQYPAGGEAAPLNSQVLLVVRRPIPVVAGLRYADAVLKLREYGWKVQNPAAFKGLTDPWVLDQEVGGDGKKITKLLPDADTAVLSFKLTPGVKVPGDLIGRTPAAAEEVLKAAGLTAKYDKPDTPFWRVEGTDPVVGKLVPLGAEVKLTLKDIGKKVPRVVGLPFAEAEADLTGHGVKFEWTDKPKAGEVVFAQGVKEGSVIDPAETVKLTPGYRVPALQQLSVADARAAVEATGGTLPEKGVKERTVPTEVEADDGKTEVEGQTPEAGSLAERGAAVGVTAVRYAFKDPRLEVPKFVGMTEGQADRAADGLFELSKDWQEEQTADPALAGKTLVTRQSPDAGGKLARLGVVTLTFTTYTAPPAPAKVKVPDYLGMTADAATVAEGRLDVRFAHGKAVINPDKAGRTEVTAQDRRAGAEVDEGTTVTLTLTRFVGRNDPPPPPPPPPVEKMRVPDVSGRSVADAKAILTKFGFKPAVGAATAGPPPGNDPRKAGRTEVSSTSPAAFTAQPVGATVEINTVTYTDAKPPPASKELVCYGTGWAVSPTRGSSVIPNKLTLSADRKTVTMTAMVGTLKGDVLTSPDALKAKKPVWDYKQVEMTGTLMKDGTGNGVLAYQFDKYLAFQIPDDGEGEGAWVKSQAWSKTTQDGKTVYFTTKPSK